MMTDTLYAHLLSVYWLFVGAGALIILEAMLAFWIYWHWFARRISAIHIPTEIDRWA